MVWHTFTNVLSKTLLLFMAPIIKLTRKTKFSLDRRESLGIKID
jgi:hypothetical protein